MSENARSKSARSENAQSESTLQLQKLEFNAWEQEEAPYGEAPYVIPHEKAYRHTKNTIAGLTQAMEDYKGRGGKNLPPAMRQAVLDGMQSLIEEWSVQMRDYEALKSGRATLALHSLRELPTTLVKARLAAGLTQKQLAERLGLKPQQIQRYEATRYRTITFARLLEIAEVLGVQFEAQVQVGAPHLNLRPTRRRTKMKHDTGRDNDSFILQPQETKNGL